MRDKVIVYGKRYISDFFNKESRLFSFLRFGTIGVINTVHYYAWYLLLLHFKVPYVISHTTAFILSMIGSYFLNCFFTFKVRPTLIKFIKYPLTTVSNYIISTVSLVFFVHLLHVKPSVAALIASILPIPITFVVTRKILKKPDSKIGTE